MLFVAMIQNPMNNKYCRLKALVPSSGNSFLHSNGIAPERLVFRPSVVKRSVAHIDKLSGECECDGHRHVVVHVKSFLVVYDVGVLELDLSSCTRFFLPPA